MKAVVHERFGPPEVLHLTDVDKPAPADDEVLVRIHATTVTSADWRLRSSTVPTGFGFIMRLLFGFRKPRLPVLGSELAGEVEAVGRDVTAFAVGDEVFAFNGAKLGCHAEYKCVPQDGAIARKPAGLDWGEAAALSFGGTTALDFLRRGGVRGGERVLVNGASGSVGTAAVQLARHMGADVTGVCGPANLELVRSLGAAHVVDYTKEDFTRNGETYDVIMDTAGTAPWSRCKRSLRDGGRLLLVLAGLPQMLPIPWVALTTSRRIVAGPASERADDLRHLARLAEAGAFRPVIDRRYPLDRIVDAHRYVDTGRKRGNVVVTVTGADAPRHENS